MCYSISNGNCEEETHRRFPPRRLQQTVFLVEMNGQTGSFSGERLARLIVHLSQKLSTGERFQGISSSRSSPGLWRKMSADEFNWNEEKLCISISSVEVANKETFATLTGAASRGDEANRWHQFTRRLHVRAVIIVSSRDEHTELSKDDEQVPSAIAKMDGRGDDLNTRISLVGNEHSFTGGWMLLDFTRATHWDELTSSFVISE
ncbi:hypothetical protein L249_4352 [Ophiocordyceps polyrhachis-furcata BCC 54312]|uniref:Uncharacterized protein n=1 Tax=Ophiocordyceps polyrhachis-furcata BCC 54312 TaxID=1330021 RepID=A0A367L7K5_9HYPO|nr:hypothetical protein L249_4352 [Ophiocordyceps polyrhachis-furcata BCC 54312]